MVICCPPICFEDEVESSYTCIFNKQTNIVIPANNHKKMQFIPKNLILALAKIKSFAQQFTRLVKIYSTDSPQAEETGHVHAQSY